MALQLRNSENGAILAKGSHADIKGSPVEITGWQEPRHSGSTGRVYIRYLNGGQDAEYFPSVIGAEFAPEGSPFFSQQLRRELRDHSHGILEDNLTYEDEGAEGSPGDQFGGKLGLAGIVLDHLSHEAITEYRAAVEKFGGDTALEEASRHVYEP